MTEMPGPEDEFPDDPSREHDQPFQFPASNLSGDPSIPRDDLVDLWAQISAEWAEGPAKGIGATQPMKEQAEQANMTYFHPWNQGQNTGPDTFNRGIPPQERQAHVESVRSTEREQPHTPTIGELQEKIDDEPPGSFIDVLSEVASTIVETGYGARGIDPRDKASMLASTSQVPQPALRRLVQASYLVAGPIDPFQEGRELKWAERRFHELQTNEERIFNELTGSSPHTPVILRAWPYLTRWGIHQHQVPDKKVIPKAPILGFKRRPEEIHVYRNVDDPGSEYPVNQVLSHDQSYALRAITDSSTPRAMVAQGRYVARAEIVVPPFTVASFHGKPVDRPYDPANRGVKYTVFEDYDGNHAIARTDRRSSDGRPPRGISYRATSQEVTGLTKALLQFSWLDRK